MANLAVFISFRGTHRNEAKSIKANLETELQSKKCSRDKVWMDEEQIHIGNSLNKKIIQGIYNAELFICCLSKDYTESKFCCMELVMADCLDKEILPVLLEEMDLESQLIDCRTKKNLYPTIEKRKRCTLASAENFFAGCRTKNMQDLLDSVISLLTESNVRTQQPKDFTDSASNVDSLSRSQNSQASDSKPQTEMEKFLKRRGSSLTTAIQYLITPICNILYQKSLLEATQKQTIMAQPTPFEQATKLLDIMLSVQHKPNALEIFCGALHTNGISDTYLR